MGKKVLKWLNHIVTSILIIVLFTVAALVVSSKISGGEPNIFGYQLKTVLSGSMEPGIKTGSIIVVKPTEDKEKFKKGDVITFMDEQQRVITHRITEVINSDGKILYRTKGDNNNAEDQNPVPSDNVLAEYTGVTIPYIGYIQDFASSKNGILVMVIIPGVLLLAYSGFTIWRTLAQLEKQYKQKIENQNESKALDSSQSAADSTVTKS